MTGNCPPGSVFGSGCFKNVENTAGADTISRLYALESNGQIDASTTNGILASIVAYGYTIATLTCQQAFVNDQTITIDCNNAYLGQQVKDNPNCSMCKARAAANALARQQLEVDAHNKNPSYVKQVVNPDVAEAYFGVAQDHEDGICKYVCLQCVAESVSQNIQMQIVADCSVDTNEFVTAFTSGMSVQAETEISRYQQALQTTGLEIKSKEDVKSLSFQIADTIREMTTIKQLNGLNESALNIQNMEITPESTSVMIQNTKQAITTSMFASLTSQIYTDTNVQSSINYSLHAQTIQIETTFTNLVNSLQNTVTTIDGLLINTVGKIMITLLVFILIVMFIFAAFFFFKPSFIFGGALDDDDDEQD